MNENATQSTGTAGRLFEGRVSPASLSSWFLIIRSIKSKFAPSYRRLYVRWITDAKREETRRKRLAEAVARLERNEKLGLK